MEAFEQDLNALIDDHLGSLSRDEIISALELRVMAMREEDAAADD